MTTPLNLVDQYLAELRLSRPSDLTTLSSHITDDSVL
jgi:hypothetical protein